MTDAFDVDADPYDGINLEKIASEETFKQSVRVANTWRENIRSGEGAAGDHGSPFVNTGEAANDVTVDPQQEGALEYVVGGDVIQLLIAEVGRAPGEFPPPEPIADWMREQLGVQDPDPFPVQRHIAEEGIEGFAPARGAANQHKGELEENVLTRIEAELEQQ